MQEKGQTQGKQPTWFPRGIGGIILLAMVMGLMFWGVLAMVVGMVLWGRNSIGFRPWFSPPTWGCPCLAG